MLTITNISGCTELEVIPDKLEPMFALKLMPELRRTGWRQTANHKETPNSESKVAVERLM
jgi:hypothetical protein